jgi:glycosyltransferase involved in cell wall biosynthesis
MFLKRMKIVHCLFTMETGGAQVLAVDLLNEMSELHDVSLIIINNKWNNSLLKQLDRRVNVFYINRKEGNHNPLPLIKLNLLLLKLKPDIIHCHEPKVAKIIKTRYGRLLQSIHDMDISTSCYHLYDGLAAVSDAVYKDVTSRYDVTIKKVYNGIPIHLFKQRKEYSLIKGEPVKLIQVSRLMHEKKGQDILLHALHNVIYEYGFSDFSLDFIGSGSSYQYLTDLVTELGLKNHVNFLGEKSRNWLFTNLSDYHILIQPSRYEGFGLTILEGFAAGLPVLACDIDGPAEIIGRVSGGFLFEKEDTTGCAKKLYHILTLYEHNEISALMEQTIPVIKQEYSIKACTKKYLSVYASLINPEPASRNILS